MLPAHEELIFIIQNKIKDSSKFTTPRFFSNLKQQIIITGTGHGSQKANKITNLNQIETKPIWMQKSLLAKKFFLDVFIKNFLGYTNPLLQSKILQKGNRNTLERLPIVQK